MLLNDLLPALPKHKGITMQTKTQSSNLTEATKALSTLHGGSFDEADILFEATESTDVNENATLRESYASGESQHEHHHHHIVHIDDTEEGFSTPASTSVVINYISAGYILLPRAFALGGTLLSCIIVAIVSLQSYITSIFLLETCARAEALASKKDSIPEVKEDSIDGREEPRQQVLLIRARKFDLSLLNSTFLKPATNNFFTITTALDLYGITWTFCSVFASTFADRISIAGIDDDYRFYIVIFVIITLPLSCTSLLDQFYLQMGFLVLRLLMIALMVGTLAAAYSHSEESHFGDLVGPSKAVPLAGSGSNLMQVIQLAVFSTAFQFSVPTIGGVSKEKSKLKKVFFNAVGFIYVSNIVVSLLISIYFGPDHTEASSNLNWLDYHGGTMLGDEDERSVWSRVISGYIVLFAAIDGLAVYPLIALSLGDILMAAFYRERVHEAEKDWKIRTGFRLLAASPQAVGALFIKDLGAIATYAGIFTLLSYTACPALLYLKSAHRMEEEGLPVKTFYETPLFSNKAMAYILLLGVALTIAGVIVDAALT